MTKLDRLIAELCYDGVWYKTFGKVCNIKKCNRADKKQGSIDKLMIFFEKYLGLV